MNNIPRKSVPISKSNLKKVQYEALKRETTPSKLLEKIIENWVKDNCPA